MSRLAAALVLAAAAAQAAPAPPGRHTVAMLGVASGAGFDPKVVATVEEMLLVALDQTGRFAVTGQSDIARLVGF